MRFLLRLVKLRRDDPMIPLRIQKQSECLNLHSGKPDDKILDCCLFFGPNCGRIWLWTKDLNLNVKVGSPPSGHCRPEKKEVSEVTAEHVGREQRCEDVGPILSGTHRQMSGSLGRSGGARGGPH